MAVRDRMNRDENNEDKTRTSNPALRAMLEDAGIVLQDGAKSGDKSTPSKKSGPTGERSSAASSRISSLPARKSGTLEIGERRKSQRPSLAPSKRDSVVGRSKISNLEGRKSSPSRTSRGPLEKRARDSARPGDRKGGTDRETADSDRRSSARPSASGISRAPLDRPARTSSITPRKSKSDSVAPGRSDRLSAKRAESLPPDPDRARVSTLPPPDPGARATSIPPPVPPRRPRPSTARAAKMVPPAAAASESAVSGKPDSATLRLRDDAAIDTLFREIASRDGARGVAKGSGSFFDTYGFAATAASADETSAEHGPFDDMEDIDGRVPSLRRRGKRFYALVVGGVLLVGGGLAAALLLSVDPSSADEDEDASSVKQASLAPSAGDDAVQSFSGRSPTQAPPAPVPATATPTDPPATPGTGAAEQPAPAGEGAPAADSSPTEEVMKSAGATDAATKAADKTVDKENTPDGMSSSPARSPVAPEKSTTVASGAAKRSRSNGSSPRERADESRPPPSGKSKSELASILDGSNSSMRDVGIDRSRESVKKGFQKVARYAKRCSRTEKRLVVVSVTIAPNGRVTRAVPTGDFAHTEVGRCVAAAAKNAKFPPSMKEMTVQYPFHP